MEKQNVARIFDASFCRRPLFFFFRENLSEEKHRFVYTVDESSSDGVW